MTDINDGKLIRESVVAGKFYPLTKSDLIQQIERVKLNENQYLHNISDNNEIIGGIVPHAGYIFSLHQAIHLFLIIEKSKQQFDTVIIVNPDHYGAGDNISIDGHDEWATPLGNIPVDRELADTMNLPSSIDAQRNEHSAEVIIPLLQYFLNYNFKILPISMKSQTFKNSLTIAEEVYKSSKKLNKKVLFIASTDFSHFESPEFGYSQDEYAVNEILKLNSRNLINQVKKHNISMCGYGPVMSLIEFSKMKYKTPEALILKRGHSGEVYASDEVVDYVSFLFYEG